MSKITYTNKVTLNDYPDIANINKCTADDLNEIKTVVNANDDNVGNLADLDTSDTSSVVDAINETYKNNTYSTTEQVVGKWIDGKSIYRKVIDIGALPDTAQKTVASGVDFSTAFLVKMYGVCKYSGSNVSFPLPFANPATLEYSIMLNIDNQNNVVITTGTDRTGYFGYVIIEYTKE